MSEIIPASLTYAALKEAHKKAVDTLSYNEFFMLSACTMFEYVDKETGEPFDAARMEFVELYNMTQGACAVIDSKEFGVGTGTNNPEMGLLVTFANRAGSPNSNGLGRDLICITGDGRSVTIRDFETEGKNRVAYFKNNAYAFPDFTIGESGDIMAEIQKSKRHNIVNSRLTPIVVVKDAKAKSAIEKALAENKSGSYAVVLSDNIFSEGQEFVLKVTDVKDQDKIQYLNHAYDDELRHWYNLHGLDVTGASKQAQQSVEEVSSGLNSRKILPYAMLAAREKAVAHMNEIFGTNCEVRFSKAWRLEFGLEMTPVDALEDEISPENDEDGENIIDDETAPETGENEASDGGEE